MTDIERLQKERDKLLLYAISHGGDLPQWCPVEWEACPIGDDSDMSQDEANRVCMNCPRMDVLGGDWFPLPE